MEKICCFNKNIIIQLKEELVNFQIYADQLAHIIRPKKIIVQKNYLEENGKNKNKIYLWMEVTVIIVLNKIVLASHIMVEVLNYM